MPCTAWGAVAVLLVVYVFSFADRQILSLLVAPIRADLDITDTQFSLLTGPAFALFYTVLGLPFGRLADRMSRRRLIAVGAFFWSLMTLLSGFTRTYAQLFLARVGVGVGEAALGRAAFSMMGDLFPPERRARAFSVYGLGIYIGAGVAFGLGGVIVGAVGGTPRVSLPLVGEVASWHAVFIALGLPGLLLPLLLLAVPEPVRRGLASAQALAPGVRDAAAWVWHRRRLFAPYFLGFGFLVLGGFAVLAWTPELFRRAHGIAPRDAGVRIGVTMAISGTLGILAGGALVDRLKKLGRRDGVLIAGIASAVLGAVPGALFPIVASADLAFALLALVFFFGAFASGAAPAALGLVTPNQLRGQVSALYLLVISLVGIGLGPTAPALLTDFLFRNEQKLGQALALVAVATSIISAAFLVFARAGFGKPGHFGFDRD